MKLKILYKFLVYLILIIILSFLLPRIIPGSPLSYDQNDTYILNQNLPEETFNQFNEYYMPEKSIIEQFILYVKNLCNFDLGYSFYYKLPVSTLILKRLPYTLALSAFSMIIATILAIKLGISTALKNKSNKICLILIIAIQSMPAFLIATLMQAIFAYKFKLFPAWGAYTPGIEFFSTNFFFDFVLHLILPLTTMIICEIPGIFILTYNSTQKIKNENYTIMAHFLNINDKLLNKNFIYKNIIPEILGKLNIQVIYALTGSLFIEIIFSYPGIGQLLKNAASSRDYPMMQGILLFACIFGLIINTFFEILLKKNTTKY